MNCIENILKNITVTTTAHRTLCNHVDNGILSAGLIYKNVSSGKEQHTFTYYGGLLILRGTGRYFDENGYEKALYPGCFVQRLPGVRHTTIVDEDWVEVYVCIGRTLFEALAELGLADNQKPVLEVGLFEHITDKFVLLLNGLKTCSQENLNQMMVLAQSLIVSLTAMDKNNNDKGMKTAMQVCDLLSQNLSSKRTIREILEQNGYGYEKTRKLFKEKMNISPGEYRISRRLDLAKEYLISKDMTIEEIADALGYCDPFVFSKQFAKKYKLAPSKYRKLFTT